MDSEERGGPLSVLRDGELWFRERIPTDVPWGDESFLEPVPTDAVGCFGLKVATDSEIDGQRYRTGEIVVVDSLVDLRRLLERFPAVSELILPWYGRLIPGVWIEPHRETVDLVSYRTQFAGRFVRSLLLTTGIIAVGFAFSELRMLALLFATVYGFSPLVESGLAWMRRVDRYSVDELNRRLVNFELFRRWILQKRSPLLRVGLFCLVAIFAGQMWVGIEPSIEAAALLKSEVFSGGEWWRTVTTGLMHGSLLHILFNGMALYSLGRVIVALVSPPLLSFVFLVTVVAGSLASLYLGPAVASVGASGGILGCLGFLLVLTFKFRTVLPGFLQANLIQSTLVVAIFGALGAGFIDNAAHAGGLVGGVLLGLLAWPWIRLAPVTVKPGVRLLSLASLTVLGAGLGKIAWELWKLAPL